jgi:hypothetical protein
MRGIAKVEVEFTKCRNTRVRHSDLRESLQTCSKFSVATEPDRRIVKIEQ